MNINLGMHYINSVNSICGLSFTDFIPACFEHFTGAGVDGNWGPGSQASRARMSMRPPTRLHLHWALGVLQPLSIERGPLTVCTGRAVKAGEAVNGVRVCWTWRGHRSGRKWRGCHWVLWNWLGGAIETWMDIVHFLWGRPSVVAVVIVIVVTGSISFSLYQGWERIVWTEHAGGRRAGQRRAGRAVSHPWLDVISQSLRRGGAGTMRRPSGMPDGSLLTWWQSGSCSTAAGVAPWRRGVFGVDPWGSSGVGRWGQVVGGCLRGSGG